MAKISRSFRAKMVLLFGISMFLSSLTAFILFKLLQFYYRTNVESGHLADQLRQLLRKIGDFNVFFILFLILSIVYFFLLTKSYSHYFKEISAGISYLANGNFNHKVHIQSNDEFADIARDINLAGETLKEAVQRGDFSESSKDQLVVNLAHDLRTPLTSVLGYMDLILRDKSLSKEQISHYLKIAYTKSERLEVLIDELFEITRMNYGMLPLQKENINVRELIFQLTEELYPILDDHSLKVRINSDKPLQITCDGSLLARVLENIIMSAIRYGSDGQYIDINGFVAENTVIIQVVNYGHVIAKDDLPHLFDMFYTGDKARTQKSASTGLGLFIAKNIIEQHGGSLTCKSDIKGTVFEVVLPKEN